MVYFFGNLHDVYRVIGDLSHLIAMLALLFNILKTRSCSGLSGKTQVMFALVFITRYLDLFTNFVSPYNTMMKIIYILCTCTTVLLIYWIFRKSYNKQEDKFWAVSLIIPAVILALLVNHEFDPFEILWTFSIYLESVAILPQLYMTYWAEVGSVGAVTIWYLIGLGSYRFMYEMNWIWRYQFEGFLDLIVIVAGIVQTIIYLAFFVIFNRRIQKAKKVSKPTNSEVLVSNVSGKCQVPENDKLLPLLIAVDDDIPLLID